MQWHMYLTCLLRSLNFLINILGMLGIQNKAAANVIVISHDQLTWHDGAIPPNEIWIKIGGDKGGGTFKMNFQICNVDSPNSKTNTCIFCIFLAYDSVTNLHIGLDRYADQVQDLQNMKWRYILIMHTIVNVSL